MIVEGFIHCERCAVWRPREEVTFYSPEEAEKHIAECHLNRLHQYITLLTEGRSYIGALRWALRNHNDEEARKEV